MAACCIVIAIIIAQITATLRRWAVFWGFVAPGEYDDPNTLLRCVRTWLTKPAVRTAFAFAVALEIGGLGSWVYVAHGEHLARLADQTLGRIRGEQIVYAPVCGKRGERREVRIVLAGDVQGPGSISTIARP